jgi:hypothetical protein
MIEFYISYLKMKSNKKIILPESIQEISSLLIKYLCNELTAEEYARLKSWASAAETNRVFLDNLASEKIIRVNADYNEAAVWQKIDKAI